MVLLWSDYRRMNRSKIMSEAALGWAVPWIQAHAAWGARSVDGIFGCNSEVESENRGCSRGYSFGVSRESG